MCQKCKGKLRDVGITCHPFFQRVLHISSCSSLDGEEQYRSFVPPYPFRACDCDAHTRLWQTTRCQVRLQGVSPSGHAEQGILLFLSLVENMPDSYSPQGIDLGIDLGNDRYILLRTQ